MEKITFIPAVVSATVSARSKGSDCCSVQGRRILTETVDGLRVWNAVTGQCIDTFVCLNCPIVTATFCTGGEQVLVRFVDGSAVIWKVSKRICLPIFVDCFVAQ